MRIATSYPNLLKRYMKAQGVPLKAVADGSVKLPAQDLPMICDLVSPAQLEANGLKEVEVIYRSKPV